MGKDQYLSSLGGMVEGRVLPWVEDVQSEGYPEWSAWGASQRDAFFVNRDGELDTTFSLTPLNPGDQEDYDFIMDLILGLRDEGQQEPGMRGDVNNDENIDILDVITVVRIILDLEAADSEMLWRTDCNQNGEIEITDAIGIINVILGLGTCPF